MGYVRILGYSNLPRTRSPLRKEFAAISRKMTRAVLCVGYVKKVKVIPARTGLYVAQITRKYC